MTLQPRGLVEGEVVEFVSACFGPALPKIQMTNASGFTSIRHTEPHRLAYAEDPLRRAHRPIYRRCWACPS